MNNRILELAIKGLEAERARLDQELADLKKQLNGGRRKAFTADGGEVPIPFKRKRKGVLTAAGRKKLSDMMKARWAAKRKAAAKKA